MRITITGKVVLVFLLMAAALGMAIIFMSRALHEVGKSVDIVGEPNRKLQTWKSAIEELNTASASLQRWKIGRSEQELNVIDSCRQGLYDHFEELQSMNRGNTAEENLTDSLQILTGEWFENLGDEIVMNDTSTSSNIVIDNILREMAEREAAHAKLHHEKEKIKEEGQPGENGHHHLNPDTTVAYPAVTPGEKDDNFWHRLLFGKRKKNPGELAASKTADTSNQAQVAPQPNIQPNDTIGKEPLIETSRIRNAIYKGQERQMSIAEARLREEMNLLRTDNALMTRIRKNSDDYEKIVTAETADLVHSASEATGKGTTTIMWWVAGIALFFVALFGTIIENDLRRERRVKKQLEVARENAERLAKAKEEFLANMSHEIRTPLNIIGGFSAQLLKSRLNSTQRMQAEGIGRSSDHLMALVNDILDFSKMESGKLQLERIGFSPRDLENDIIAAFSSTAGEKGLDFRVHTTGDLPEVLIGDPVRIRQILFNLVSNSLKFTEKGSIEVSIFNLENQPPGVIGIRVTDTGIGISQEKLHSIFDAFTQADTSISRRYGGTGLGLTITRFLVEKMEGNIDVDSTPGKGSVFSVTLPLTAGTRDDLPVAYQNNNNMGSMLNNKKVLVCDDEPFNRILASHVLQSYGAVVLEAGDGKEAIDVLGHEKIDLVLMDLQMPGMSGKETTQAIRATQNGFSKVKIIAVTGRAYPGEKEKCFEAGMNGYLAKPYKEEQLLREISDVLAG